MPQKDDNIVKKFGMKIIKRDLLESYQSELDFLTTTN